MSEAFQMVEKNLKENMHYTNFELLLLLYKFDEESPFDNGIQRPTLYCSWSEGSCIAPELMNG
jgi:hypothetical protein